MSIRFDDKVAIITGAGNGLGREHALAFAARGAKVVVNDLGGARDGTGASANAAEEVVKEIVDAGGEAMANGADITKHHQVEQMVEDAMAAWGRVDILVNNAGVLRDKTFAKMELGDFEFVMDVHVNGTVNCTKAVWQIMRDQNYGRIVNTTSSSGLYGNFGQSNYGAAKMAVVGFMNTLEHEGAKSNIRINCLAPTAATRMTFELMPEEMHGMLDPKYVSPGVLFLCSEDAPSGEILTAGAACFARAKMVETRGVFLGADTSPETVADAWNSSINSTEGEAELKMGGEQTGKWIELVTEANK